MLKFVTAKVGILANDLNKFLLYLSLPDFETDTRQVLANSVSSSLQRRASSGWVEGRIVRLMLLSIWEYSPVYTSKDRSRVASGFE